MGIRLKSAIAGFAGLVTTFVTIVPAEAQSFFTPKLPSASEVEQVQYSRDRHRRGFHNGYHGSRNYHRGWRRHNDGWWYPLAAFGAGAIIGGAISNQNNAVQDRSYGFDRRHYDWCAQRYRTYRPSDNTYVPRAGMRAECVSPYSR